MHNGPKRPQRRRLRSAVGTGLVLAIAVFTWLAWPVYEFYAHRGKLPLPPTGWTTLPSQTPAAQHVHEPAYQAAGAAALQHVQHWRDQVAAPAFSAAVAIDGRLVWTGVVGWADLQARRPVAPTTRFRIGSTSKALTATALAKLVDRKVIDLDAPIGTYLTPLPNPDWQAMTARHLASHSAGLPHYKENTDLWGLYATIALDRHFDRMTNAMTLFDESDLLFAPGTGFHYSSLGTVVLGAVIAAAAERPYLTVMAEEVFEPAGMSRTVVAPPAASVDDDFATFYVRRGPDYRPWRPVDLSHRLPGGGFASTPSDLARLGSKILEDTYLSASTRTEFWTPQRLANGQTNPQDYALGWRWRVRTIEGVGRVAYANHGGVSRGAQCWLLVAPELRLALALSINIVTPNFGDFAGVTDGIIRAFAPRTAPPG